MQEIIIIFIKTLSQQVAIALRENLKDTSNLRNYLDLEYAVTTKIYWLMFTFHFMTICNKIFKEIL